MKGRVAFEYFLNKVMLASLFLISVILPLYHREGFVMIGDRKYTFFLLVSVVVSGCLLIDGVRRLIRGTFEVSWFQRMAILYGGAVMISAYKSRYPQTAMWGYQDWHMGLVSQLLFLSIFFAASQTSRIQELILPWMLRSAMVVFLIGVLNRFNLDPLGMFGGLEYWNRTHLLSTIGNMNWYSGYMIFLFAIGYVLYLQKEKKIELLVFVIIGFVTILTQGSESGILSCGILLFLSLLYAALQKDMRLVGRVQDSLILMGITGLGASLISSVFPKMRNFADDAMTEQLLKPALWIALLVVVLFFGILFRIAQRKGRQLYVSFSILLVATLSFLVVVWNLRFLLEEWGSGRIELWKMSWKAYCEMPLLNQLIGVGPDCYAHYMYDRYPEEMMTILGGYWGDAIIANAHNEWINRLICTGALGYVTYMGMVIGAIVLFYKNQNKNQYFLPLAAGLVVIMMHQTASFQHVMVTPFIFLVMGMGANIIADK